MTSESADSIPTDPGRAVYQGTFGPESEINEPQFSWLRVDALQNDMDHQITVMDVDGSCPTD